jgi:tetratricopeptide (TPR) repeat protein
MERPGMEAKEKTMGKARLDTAPLLLACALLFSFLASCTKGYGDLAELERGSRKNLGPATAAEIQASILEYQKVVEKKVHASDRISYYYKMLGLEYMKRKMYGEAYKAFAQALEISPQNANLYYYAGICAAYMSKSEIGLEDGSDAKRLDYLSKAEKAYKRSLDIEHENSRTMYALAVLYALELSRPDDAAPLLEDYMSRNVKDVSSRFLMASVRYSQGRYEDALVLYDWIYSNSTLESEKRQAMDNKAKVERLLDGGK